jgi:hypothetical protein
MRFPALSKEIDVTFQGWESPSVSENIDGCSMIFPFSLTGWVMVLYCSMLPGHVLILTDNYIMRAMRHGGIKAL